MTASITVTTSTTGVISMTELDAAMLARIREIVLKEERPFCYLDFLSFEMFGKKYSMSHGTFRNKICKLIKEGVIELEMNSGIAFYTLCGHRFARARKPTRMRVSHHQLYDLILDLPLGRRAIHDIRLQFRSPHLWELISRFSTSINPFSKDISLSVWKFEEATVKATIHKSDTVSIIVACSSKPFPLDYEGILRLSNCLTRTMERFQMHIVETCGSARSPDDSLILVPSHMKWIVTMWHFGADAMTEYTGQKFCMTWKVAEDILVRAYSKKVSSKTLKIRLERQECPRKPLMEAIQEKLS